MAAYSVAETKAKLTKLLVAADNGEEVTITRRGKVVARIVPEPDPERGRCTQAFLDSLAIDLDEPLERSAVDILREMRNEGA